MVLLLKIIESLHLLQYKDRQLRRFINYPQLLDLLLNISPELIAAYRFKNLCLCFNMVSDYENADHDFSDFMKEVKNYKSL